jgi:transcriptional regulator with XRE-family HTH domain
MGARIRELREGKRLTQHDLADKLRKRGYGTTQTTVSRWESGQLPRGYVARALAEELGTTLDELYRSDDDEESRAMPLTRGEFEMLGQLMARLGGTLALPGEKRAARS